MGCLQLRPELRRRRCGQHIALSEPEEGHGRWAKAVGPRSLAADEVAYSDYPYAESVIAGSPGRHDGAAVIIALRNRRDALMPMRQQGSAAVRLRRYAFAQPPP